MSSKLLNSGLLLAPRALMGAVVLAISATALMQSASAERGGRSWLLDVPAAAVEPKASEAQVVSEAPLWKFVSLENCNVNYTTCYTRLPPVPAKERWQIQFVSCTVDTQLDASFRHFSLQVYNRALTKLLGYHFLAATYQSPRQQAAVHVASQPMVLQVQTANVLYVTALSSGSMGGGQCNITGLRQILE